MTRLLQTSVCIVCLALSACTTQTGLREELERSVKTYNRMVRWQEIENAVTTFADQEQREECLKRADTLKKNGLSITDFRILATRFHPEKQAGDVVTEFDYYMLPSNRVKTASHRQEWVYRENSKSWRLKNGLPPFE